MRDGDVLYWLDANDQAEYGEPQGGNAAHGPFQCWSHGLMSRGVRAFRNIPENLDTDECPCEGCLTLGVNLRVLMRQVCLRSVCNRKEHECISIQEVIALLLRMDYPVAVLKKWLSQVYFTSLEEPWNVGWTVPRSAYKQIFTAASRFSLWMG